LRWINSSEHGEKAWPQLCVGAVEGGERRLNVPRHQGWVKSPSPLNTYPEFPSSDNHLSHWWFSIWEGNIARVSQETLGFNPKVFGKSRGSLLVTELAAGRTAWEPQGCAGEGDKRQLGTGRSESPILNKSPQ